MSGYIGNQQRAVDPYAPVDSDVVSLLTAAVSHTGRGVCTGLSIVINSEFSNKLDVSTGVVLKDYIAIRFPHDMTISLQNTAGQAGHNYVVLDYRYRKELPPPDAILDVIPVGIYDNTRHVVLASCDLDASLNVLVLTYANREEATILSETAAVSFSGKVKLNQGDPDPDYLINKVSNTTFFINPSERLDVQTIPASSIPNNAINADKIAEGSISYIHLDSLDVPADGQIITWNAAQNQFEWIHLGTLSDDKVKASSTDPAAGFLDSKVDGITVEINGADRLAIVAGSIDATHLADNIDMSSRGFDANYLQGHPASDFVLAGGDVPIGDPTLPAVWPDGFFDTWTSATRLADALYDISVVIKDIIPPQPTSLLGLAVDVSAAVIAAKLSSGLSGTWYDYHSAGDTINLTANTAYSVSTTNPSNAFYVGKDNAPSTFGVLQLNRSGAVLDTIDLATTTTGIYTTVVLSQHNTFWRKGQATANITYSADGSVAWKYNYSLSGDSATAILYHDVAQLAPAFSVLPSVSASPAVYRWLSGIQYYNTGTVFLVSFTAAVGIFDRVYHPTAVAEIDCPGASVLTPVNPATVPAYNDSFVVTNQAVSPFYVDFIDLTPEITVTLRKPYSSVSASTSLSYGIFRGTSTATNTYEDFKSESYRWKNTTTPSWNSVTLLVNGEAQVKPAVLMYPDAGQYPGFSGSQVYYRPFTFSVPKSNGTLRISGPADIAPAGTGNINVEIYLENDAVWLDLGRNFGDLNGCRTGKSGNDYSYTLGVYSTALNNNRYIMRVTLRNSNETITAIQDL